MPVDAHAGFVATDHPCAAQVGEKARDICIEPRLTTPDPEEHRIRPETRPSPERLFGAGECIGKMIADQVRRSA